MGRRGQISSNCKRYRQSEQNTMQTNDQVLRQRLLPGSCRKAAAGSGAPFQTDCDLPTNGNHDQRGYTPETDCPTADPSGIKPPIWKYNQTPRATFNGSRSFIRIFFYSICRNNPLTVATYAAMVRGLFLRTQFLPIHFYVNHFVIFFLPY